jgi:protein-tyrosine-phosphatase
MSVERITEVERRAGVYAALADPTRLQVVDRLTLGDAASSELSEQLGIASNLLAHHLKILETAGLIVRHRSEGDGRRSYWRLVHHAFEPLGSPTIGNPERIVFVCTANTARSHLAAALWREMSPIPSASAGTHPAERIDPGAVAAARRHHLDLPDLPPRHWDDVVGAGDLVVTVCDLAHEEIGAGSTLHWSIPDPVGAGTKSAFDRAYDALAARVRLLAPVLNPAS